MEATKRQRKKESEAFLAKNSDDGAAIELLQMAKKVLAKYYKEAKLPVLLGVKQGPDFKKVGGCSSRI